MKFRHLLCAALCLAPLSASAAGIAHHFNGRWGAMEIYDARSTLSFRVNLPRLAERASPCSTFYLPTAVIGLRTGVLKPTDTALAWDNTRFPAEASWPASWQRQHDLRSAARDSVPWYLQDLINRLGPQKVKTELAALKYGNADISSGLNHFWRNGSLQISGLEQVDFLRSLRNGKVGLNAQQTRALLDTMELDRAEDYVMYGKTGSCTRAEGDVYGWFVGLVEKAGQPRAYFAMTVDGVSVADVATPRRKVVMDALVDLGFWAPPAPVLMVADAAGTGATLDAPAVAPTSETASPLAATAPVASGTAAAPVSGTTAAAVEAVLAQPASESVSGENH
jgi:beta-lactamase class D